MIRKIYYVSWVGQTATGYKQGSYKVDFAGSLGHRIFELAEEIAFNNVDVITDSVCLVYIKRVGIKIFGMSIYL